MIDVDRGEPLGSLPSLEAFIADPQPAHRTRVIEQLGEELRAEVAAHWVDEYKRIYGNRIDETHARNTEVIYAVERDKPNSLTAFCDKPQPPDAAFALVALGIEARLMLPWRGKYGSERMSSQGIAAYLAAKPGFQMLTVSAPTWQPHERTQVGAALADEVLQAFKQHKEAGTLTVENNAPRTTLLARAKWQLASELGLDLYLGRDVLNYSRIHQQIDRGEVTLSPIGELSLGFIDRYRKLSDENIAREVVSTWRLGERFFSGEEEQLRQFEEQLLENRDLLFEAGRRKAHHLQFWAIDSFSQLLDFMTQYGSANAKAIADALDSARLGGVRTGAKTLPIGALMGLSNTLSTQVAELEGQQLSASNPADLPVALEKMFYVAHRLGSKETVYDKVADRIETIMNVIRVAAETSAEISSNIPVRLHPSHLRLIFPELSEAELETLLQKAQRAAQPQYTSTVVKNLRKLDESEVVDKVLDLEGDGEVEQ